jgi:hypothetical protein
VVFLDASQARVIGKSVVVAPEDKDQKRADDRETRRSIQMDSFGSHHADLFTSRSDRSPRTITSRRRPTVVVASCPAPINS